MKRILSFCLLVCAFLCILDGCAEPPAENVQLPSTGQQKAVATLPSEADLFSFIVLGQTTPMEVLEKVPYKAESGPANGVKYMQLIYHLSDGTQVYIYYEYPSQIVTDVVFRLTNGSEVKLSDM